MKTIVLIFEFYGIHIMFNVFILVLFLQKWKIIVLAFFFLHRVSKHRNLYTQNDLYTK